MHFTANNRNKSLKQVQLSQEQFKTLQSLAKTNMKSAFDLQRFDSIIEANDSLSASQFIKKINTSSKDNIQVLKQKPQNTSTLQKKLQKVIKKDQRILRDQISKLDVNSNLSGFSLPRKTKSSIQRPQSQINKRNSQRSNSRNNKNPNTLDNKDQQIMQRMLRFEN